MSALTVLCFLNFPGLISCKYQWFLAHISKSSMAFSIFFKRKFFYTGGPKTKGFLRPWKWLAQWKWFFMSSIARFLGAGNWEDKKVVSNIKSSALIVPKFKLVLYDSLTLGKLFKFSRTKFPLLWDRENMVSIYSLNQLV